LHRLRDRSARRGRSSKFRKNEIHVAQPGAVHRIGAVPERRYHLRVPIDVPVVLSGPSGRIDARASGLSCGGMAVFATGYEQGEAISVAMLLPGSAAPTVVDAKVAHVSSRGMGLSFEKLRSKDAQVIEEFVWQSLMPEDDFVPSPSSAAGKPMHASSAQDLVAAAAGARGSTALRVPLDVPVTIRSKRGVVEAKATGLSPGGIAIRGADVDGGEQVEVELSLPGTPAPLRVPGKVVRKGKGIAGIRFVGLSQKDLHELEATLWGFLRSAVRGAGVEPQAGPSPDRTESILAAIDETAAQAIIDGAKRPCEVEGCDRPHKARGMCARHYNQWRRRPKK